MTQYKTFFSSWTIWFGIVQIILAGLGLVSGQMDQNQALGLFTTGIGTIGLRLKTNTGITSTPTA